MSLITISTYNSAIDAHLACAKLESEEIESYILDENIVTINPLFTNMIGGIKLQVDEQDAEKAMLIIAEMNNQPITNEENNIICCPNCGSSELYSGFKSFNSFRGVISAIFSFLFMVLPIYVETNYRCKKCENEFKSKLI